MDWFPDWRGCVMAVVGSGASVRREDLDRLRGRCKVIVINNNFMLAPWADVLYAADATWWKVYPEALAFAGLKVSTDKKLCKELGLHRVEIEEGPYQDSRMSITRPGHLASGGNGGFQATNLGIQFGARRGMLIGIDFCGERWHGEHRATPITAGLPLRKAKPSTMEKFAKAFDDQVTTLGTLGVSLVNCSSISALTGYPKMSVPDALKHFGVPDRVA